MRGLLLLVLIFNASVAFAQIDLKGKIPSESDIRLFATYVPSIHKKLKFNFPRDHYQLNLVVIDSLSYAAKTPEHERSINLKDYDTFISLGSLDLVSFNKQSGLYKFKFSLNPEMTLMHSLSMVKAFPNYAAQGKVRFANNADHCFIEGKLSYVNNKPYLINLPKKHNCNIALTFMDHESFEGLFVTVTKAMPITVEVNKKTLQREEVT